MAGQRRVIISLGFGLGVLAVAGAAQAGGSGSGSGCGCVPTSHNVTVPGINITPPTVTVNASSFSYATASSSATATSSVYAEGVATAAANGGSGVIYNGGGSNWYVGEGATGVIPNLQVEGSEARRVCAEMKVVDRMVAVQAVCLDDKSVPHPASQVMPDRDILGGYEGEVYRCIAGTRMQYTLGAFAGAADFTHGQTITCEKDQALYHAATGQLACRVQKPARDCNERSLLRRYGAGIKVLKLAGARQCAAWGRETVAGASAPGSMVLDGGVGGVVH